MKRYIKIMVMMLIIISSMIVSISAYAVTEQQIVDEAKKEPLSFVIGYERRVTSE